MTTNWRKQPPSRPSREWQAKPTAAYQAKGRRQLSRRRSEETQRLHACRRTVTTCRHIPLQGRAQFLLPSTVSKSAGSGRRVARQTSGKLIIAARP